MSTGNDEPGMPCTTPLGKEATTVGLTGIRVKVNGPLPFVTGSPGSLIETVYISGVAELVVPPPRSDSNRRRRAPLEAGVVVVAVGIGIMTLNWLELESNFLNPPN